MQKGNLLTSQEIVRKFRITYQTLCHYTNIGLLNVTRKESNKRFYNERDIARRLKKIRQLREKDYSLKSILNEL
ncbi:MAG: hypothetical protein DRP85_05160 [Candidatus Makaraimicrobium thalassicum]|nr:MAG: hypothetical protein DRP85_05160 [Candidatus Omnitrophota bacterium]